MRRRRRARGAGDAGRRGRTSLRAHALLQGRGGQRTRSQCRSLTAARGCQHSGGDRAGRRGGTGGAWQAQVTRGRCAVDVGGGSGSRAAAHLKCCICDQDGRHLSSGGGPRWFDGQTRGTWRGTGPRRPPLGKTLGPWLRRLRCEIAAKFGENFKLAASGEKGKKEKRKKGEALRIFPRVPRVGAVVVERRRRAAGA